MSIQGNGFVTMPRSITSWRWYHDSNTFRVFFHLIISANFADHDFEGITIRRGQVVTSRKSLATDLKLSEREIRTALTHLKATNDIAVETTTKFSIITVHSFEKYQGATNTPTNERPTSDQRATTPEKKKKGKLLYSSEIAEIVDYLNSKLGTRYKSTTANTKKHITARLNEGYTVADFYTVIDNKVKEWRGTEYEKYLRPDTLFGSKFESYLNAADRNENNQGGIAQFLSGSPTS